MDRANNRIGIRIGAVARTPEEVVLRARRELERAIPWSGSGHDSTAIWLPSREWRTLRRDAEEGEAQSTWPRVEWRPIEDAEHLRDYAGRDAQPPFRNRRPGEEGGPCPTPVRAHLRAGHPVRASLRACPRQSPPG